MPRITVMPAEKRRWIVAYEGDPTPISEHETREEAEIWAREHAREFGQAEVIVHHLDDTQSYQQVDPERPAPTPRDVKGPSLS